MPPLSIPEGFVIEQKHILPEGFEYEKTQFDPEGSGYDMESAQPLIDEFPLTEPKPTSFQGQTVRNEGSFQAWEWHPELNDYKYIMQAGTLKRVRY